MPLTAKDLDRRITFQRPAVARDPDSNTPIGGDDGWAPVATVWAQVLDNLPSRGEASGDGINVERRPARVRIRWRDDVDSAMRMILWKGDEGGEADRVMQIVAGPADIFGRHNFSELMAEEYSSAAEVAG